jgi:hypothetical protein
MLVSPNRGIGRCVRGRLAPIMICLHIVTMLVAAGCAAPRYRTNAELLLRSGDIRTVGLMPPDIKMYEEQVRFKLVPHDDWSRQAAESVSKAFVEELASGHMRPIPLGEDDAELNDMADLYGAADLSIRTHYYKNYIDDRFSEKSRPFDYDLGPAKEAMERHGVDTVGFHLLLRLFSLEPACNFGPDCYADTDLPVADTGMFYGRITVTTKSGPAEKQAVVDVMPRGGMTFLERVAGSTRKVIGSNALSIAPCAAL